MLYKPNDCKREAVSFTPADDCRSCKKGDGEVEVGMKERDWAVCEAERISVASCWRESDGRPTEGNCRSLKVWGSVSFVRSPTCSSKAEVTVPMLEESYDNGEEARRRFDRQLDMVEEEGEGRSSTRRCCFVRSTLIFRSFLLPRKTERVRK
jgi:hypothetical protein